MPDDGREVAADVIDTVADIAAKLGALGGPGVGVAVGIGAGMVKVLAELVRSLGVDTARKTLEELKRRVDAGEGVITADDLAEDDQYVDDYIASLFGPKT